MTSAAIERIPDTGQARTWDEVRADRTDLDEGRAGEHRAEIEAEIAAYRLREIRKAQHRTQVEIAAEMEVSQRRVSEIESAELQHTEFGTLARYIEALGGRLHLVADFGDRTVTVR